MKRLKEYRIKANLSQSELAHITGLNLRMIQFYEQGKKNINHAHAESIFKLSKALSCSMDDLLEK